MADCKNCLHYEACRDVYDDLADKNYNPVFDEEDYARIGCANFTDRSEWVHLPSDEYTFTVRGDIAKGLIISNCRAAEKSIGEINNGVYREKEVEFQQKVSDYNSIPTAYDDTCDDWEEKE